MPASLIKYLSGSAVRTCMHGSWMDTALMSPNHAIRVGYTINFVSGTDTVTCHGALTSHTSGAEAYSIKMIYHQIKMIDVYYVSKMIGVYSSQKDISSIKMSAT